MHLKLIRCATVAMAAALACNGGGAGETGGTDSDTGTGGTTGEALEFADFFELAEVSYCGWATRCGAFVAEEDCRAAEFFDVIYPQGLLAAGALDQGYSGGHAVEYLQALHAAERIVFDGEAAAACLAWVDARGCLEPGTVALDEAELAGRAACQAVMRGTMVANGPCLLTAECAPQEGADVVCGFDPGCTDACCLGGCRVIAAAAIGTPCSAQTRCEAGSFCASDPNTGTFTVCTAQKPVGASCQSSQDCDDSGYCDFNTGTCAALVGEGQPCADFGEGGCQPGLFCADPGFVGNPRCYAYEAIGGPCPADWYVDGCNEIGAGCGAQSNTCAALPGPGEPCGQSGEGLCAPTATCNWYDNTCVALAREGEPCGEFLRCAGALQCDGWDPAEARCRAPVVTSVCVVPGEDELPEGT